MSRHKRKSARKSAPIDTLRDFTAVVTLVMGRPLSAAHQDAIAHYAAKKLSSRTLGRLSSKAGGTAALEFIVQTLEQPRLSR
jgi:hypothetical protein